MQALSPQQARAVAARVQSHLDAGALEEAVTLAEEQVADAIGEARATSRAPPRPTIRPPC